MKQVGFLLSAVLLSISLFGCETNKESASLQTEGVHNLTIYSTKHPSHTLSTENAEFITVVQETIESAKKEKGIANMENPEFSIKLGGETYFLWINEDVGTIMNEKDTHTIYSLSKHATKQVNDILLDLKQLK